MTNIPELSRFDGICYAGKCDEGIKVSKVDVYMLL